MNESDYFKTHLDTLYKNCFRCKLHYSAWEDLNESLSENEDLYRKFNFFWATTLKAQLEAAQLHLVKLFDKPKKSISINRLVEYAEANKEKLFDPGDFKVLENEIRNFKSEINEYEDEIKSLIDIRNNHFVHLSKEYVDEYDKLYENYSKVREDIIEILLICIDIITIFKQLAFDESEVMVTGKEYQTKELIKVLSSSI